MKTLIEKPPKISLAKLPLLLLTLPATLHAQFSFTTNNGAITIMGYTGPGVAVTIPAIITGLPVTGMGDSAFRDRFDVTSVTIPDSVTNLGNWVFGDCHSLTNVTIGNSVIRIGGHAFSNCTNLTSVTIPDSVTSIEPYAFSRCISLTNVTIGNSVTSISYGAFVHCISLTSVTIPDSVIDIGQFAFEWCYGLSSLTIGNGVVGIEDEAFDGCTNLTSVTIPNSVTSIGAYAFGDCTRLTSVYFQGNAPSLGSGSPFSGTTNVTVYYLPGTAGWGATFGNRPTAHWHLPYPAILSFGPSFGVQSNRFGFIISWATNIPVMIEASTTLATPSWSPIGTNTLTGGASYFSDPQWTNHPVRFYRLHSP